jgi:5,5'-dehydrodivanillate O-demethylase oxygenase subunit
LPDQTLSAAAGADATTRKPYQAQLADIEKVGPGTLNGRYMRRFWHPVLHAADLEVGHVKPLRILSEDFVVYRGESGKPQVMAPR